jgi:N-acetylmuramoyl-L-alanine amidase
MRNIDEIILHCSATPEGRAHDVADIRRWHVDGRGWSDIGYHFCILLDGTVEAGRPVARQGAHCKGKNKDTVGVCYIGGCDKSMKPKDTMNHGQEKAFLNLVNTLRGVYGEELMVSGHNQYSKHKSCPSFVVSEKWPDING